MWTEPIEPPSRETDVAMPRIEETADRPQCRRLAGAVAADQRDDPLLLDGERNAFQRLDLVIEDMDIVDLEKRHRATLRRHPKRVPSVWLRDRPRSPPGPPVPRAGALRR